MYYSSICGHVYLVVIMVLVSNLVYVLKWQCRHVMELGCFPHQMSSQREEMGLTLELLFFSSNTCIASKTLSFIPNSELIPIFACGKTNGFNHAVFFKRNMHCHLVLCNIYWRTHCQSEAFFVIHCSMSSLKESSCWLSCDISAVWKWSHFFSHGSEVQRSFWIESRAHIPV